MWAISRIGTMGNRNGVAHPKDIIRAWALRIIRGAMTAVGESASTALVPVARSILQPTDPRRQVVGIRRATGAARRTACSLARDAAG